MFSGPKATKASSPAAPMSARRVASRREYSGALNGSGSISGPEPVTISTCTSGYRLGQHDLLALPDRRVEATRPVGVAGGAALVDDEQQAVAVAVEAELDQPLHVARGRALAPEFASRARPVGHLAGSERLG